MHQFQHMAWGILHAANKIQMQLSEITSLFTEILILLVSDEWCFLSGVLFHFTIQLLTWFNLTQGQALYRWENITPFYRLAYGGRYGISLRLLPFYFAPVCTTLIRCN